MSPARRNAIATMLTSPLLVPEIVVGLAALQLASLSGVPLGISLLVAVHSVFVLPLATRVIMAGFSRYDLSLEEAARSLGASPRRIVLLITLPTLRPVLAAAFVLAAILSFVNLPLSMFLTSAQTATLPVILFAYMESRIDPTIAALATLVMIAAAATAFAVDRLSKVRLIGS
jgi:putative spermidine/putrescine transport system permease protein